MMLQKVARKFLIICLTLGAQTTVAANGGIYTDKTRFVRSFISNITKPLAIAIEEAEYQCNDNGGTPCTCSATSLTGTTTSDIYVDTLNVDTACKVTLTIRSTALSSTTLNGVSIDNTVPTLNVALSKTIIFTPDRSSVIGGAIKSWACTTNIDGALNPTFKGMSAITNGSSSIISIFNDEPYLGTCIYDSGI